MVKTSVPYLRTVTEKAMPQMYVIHVTGLKMKSNRAFPGSSMVRLHAPDAGGMGLIAGWGSHMLYSVAKKYINIKSNISTENEV